MHKAQEHFTYFLLLLPDLFVWIRCPVLKHFLHPQRSFHVEVSTTCLLLMLWLQKIKTKQNKTEKTQIDNLDAWIVTSLENGKAHESQEEDWIGCGILTFQSQTLTHWFLSSSSCLTVFLLLLPGSKKEQQQELGEKEHLCTILSKEHISATL